MLVYGRNVLKDINPKKVRKVYIGEYIRDEEIFKLLKKNNMRYVVISKSRLDKMVDGNHQGVVIDINDYDYYNLDAIDNDDFIVVLDHLEDTHNFGAIIRTCEAAGVKSVVIPKDRGVRVNDIVMKTSCGALDRVKIILVSNIAESLKKLQKKNYFVYSAFMDGVDYKTLDYATKKVLVIGNEGKGISKSVSDITDFKVSIPMEGSINSLNASVAAGILIFAMK